MTAFSLAPLGELASVFNGKTPSKTEHRDEGHPVLKIRDVDENGVFRGPFESFVEDAFAARHSERFAADGDTLILNAAHNADYVGSKTFFVSGECVGALATGEWLIVRPISSRLDARYINYWLRTIIARRAIRNLVKGIHLYPKDVERLNVSLPSLSQQRRIAAILDQADELRQKRRQTLEKLDKLRESIFIDTFVWNERDEWPVVRIADIATDIRTGPFGSQLLHSEFVDEGIAVLGIDNAVNNEFRWDERRFITPEKYRGLRRYTVRPGDVLITIMGTCGRCAVVPENIPLAINTKHLCCITLDANRALPAFLHASLLQHPAVLKQLGVQAKGAVMPGLNMGIIRSVELRIPPVNLQGAFLSWTDVLDEMRARYREHEDHLDTLFTSLQHRAFNGKLTSKDVERELEMVG